MDFVKVFSETVREIKREVNLKILNVPEIEQKVLDATNDEAWGPHGTALQEIAQATKKFTECQMIMNVLWTRLKDTGPNWRHVYKALTVIEYLVANGSERALDDILEHTYQISSISGFEYVEPNGKDMGINVRKKVETILALVNDKDKIQAVRDKAAANRDKYFGLSSTGITYKSSSASFGSSSYQDDRYGSLSFSRERDSFRDTYKDGKEYGKDIKWDRRNKDPENSQASANENEGSKVKKGTGSHARDHISSSSVSSKKLSKPGVTSSSNSPNPPAKENDDDFDDFDPRGSSTAASAKTNSNQVDLFGESLVGDVMDAPTSLPTKTTSHGSTAKPEVDLFADATFQEASSQGEQTTTSYTQGNIDLFSSEPVFPATFSSNVDLFAAPDAGLPSQTKAPITEATNTESFDPFAAIPLNKFDGSDPLGTFIPNSKPATAEPSQNSTNNSHNSLEESIAASSFGEFTSHIEQTNTGSLLQSTNNSNATPASLSAQNPAARKDTFQVKSGIWADSLSRGLIDLNISAPKKVNLADIGIVGGLDDGYDEKDKGAPTVSHMGRSMGTGSGLNWPAYPSSTTIGGFSTLGQQQYGSFK